MMNKETWKKHIEESENIVRPSLGGIKQLWQTALQKHADNRCPACLQRKSQLRFNLYAREKNQILKELCGTSARAARADMGL